uniref:Protein kinase domain-containing protein n=1 Tax=Triticum urartu TaxID=4572 RepID=A0A8R7QAI0_TRIUA
MDSQAITPSELERMLYDKTAEPKALPLSLLEHITSGFADDKEIGYGGFARVYKGMLGNGTISVKKLIEMVDIDEKKFSEEVRCLMKAKHKNIVRFLGYCCDTQGKMLDYQGQLVLAEVRQRLLCFEYLPKGSLDKQITDASCGLEWRKRYQIINGICDGLYYLHQKHIVHLDLKPANILLDDNMMPKIADFGLSRCFDEKQSQTIASKLIGTMGYVAPEFYMRRHITFKLDIYSLGMIIIEILTGEKGYADIDNVLEKWKSRLDQSQADTQLVQVQVCAEIAIECTDFNPAKRPDTQHIMDRLGATKSADESATETGAKIQQVTDRRETASDVEEALIVGRTEEKQKIVATLSGSITPEFTVLPIYGFGGIGKTTLAQLVFNDSQFVDYCKVWVYVSQNLDLNKIGNSIILQLSAESHVAERQMIHNKLRVLLVDKNVLIVLDDVWEKNPDTLKSLKAMLRLGVASTVTVIVTTRDEAIAREICHTIEPYKLETLTDNNCWKIIKQKTAFKDRVDKKQLKHTGREIATKCGGVALAAQSLGYALNGKTSDEWESVRDNYIWNVSTSEDPSSINNEVLASLRLSYSHMSEYLKLCFSYCAIFPKGHNIVKYDLFHQWIALRLIEPSRIFDSMQLCEKYITQLLGMSFLEYSKPPSSDRHRVKDVALFTMHDLVHNLARSILADQVNDKGGAGGNRCRYALLTDCTKPLQLSMTSPANIKALHFLDCGKLALHEDAFSLATCLHVLDLSQCLICRLPDSIGQLKQLRYLHAPKIQGHVIPSCITELSELNYLNLSGSRNISALPESIGDMKGLMHLDLSVCTGIRKLPISFTDLKQLVYLDLSYCNISISEAFGGFTKLQYLNLSAGLMGKVTNTEMWPEVFSNLIKLRYLYLSHCIDRIAPSEYKMGRLLDSISTLSNLEHLDFSYSSMLSSIPESIANLRKLHTLDLLGCHGLSKLPDSMVNMVSLKVLIVEKEVRLDESLLFLSNIASLPHFVVHASSDNCSSNIIRLKPTNPHELIIGRLENVKSAEEAQSIKLIEKQRIKDLTFQWTVDAARFVDDNDVLEKLVPPSSVRTLTIAGYRSVSIPGWLLHLPSLLGLHLLDLPKCKKLPPLGQLPNLQRLSLSYMDVELRIEQCAKLRIKPCQPRAMSLDIVDCDNVLSSWGQSLSHNTASSSSPTTHLSVGYSKVPMHQWRLLEHLPALRCLTIDSCSDLTTSPEIIQHLPSLKSLHLRSLSLDQAQAELPGWLVALTSLQELSLSGCGSLTSLPEWLGELTSLEKLEIEYCECIRSLPNSIQQLTKLEYLSIDGCRTLVKWCEKNKTKLAHIKQMVCA